MDKGTTITLGVVGGIIVVGIIAGATGNSDSSKSTQPAAKPAVSASIKPAKPAKPASKPKPDKPKEVTFKVWGTAPNGALGSLDITYGSDSDSRKGTWKNGKFTASLTFKSDAMYYNVQAQLQGSGDIKCSVTVNGKTKTAHASGGYNICDAQLSNALFGDWQ